MNYVRNYSIRVNRLSRACLRGMELTAKGELKIIPAPEHRYLFLGYLDGVDEDNRWGRFKGRFSMSSNMAYVIRAFALNQKVFERKGEITGVDEFLRDPKIDPKTKLALFTKAEAVSYVNQEDVLMYGLKGRYLWICVEVMGDGKGTIEDLCMVLPGDNFMNAFPEVYQEWNGFFHRYLSIFSSIYNDFQYQVDMIDEVLNLDTAGDELLCLFAEWMGVDIKGNFLTGEKLRTFVKEIHKLNKGKGTRRSLERLTEIILGEKAVILERNILKEHVASSEDINYDRLYGNHAYCVTLLIRNYVEENKRSQLYFLLQQFIPVRCELHLVFLDQKSHMDTYCYLDTNARLWQEETAYLDSRKVLDANVVLGEEEEVSPVPKRRRILNAVSLHK